MHLDIVKGRILSDAAGIKGTQTGSLISVPVLPKDVCKHYKRYTYRFYTEKR